MKKNNNISRDCIGTSPDPLERLSLYNSQKKALAKRYRNKKTFEAETVRKANPALIVLNQNLKSLNKFFER